MKLRDCLLRCSIFDLAISPAMLQFYGGVDELEPLAGPRAGVE
jgi:hypothetical protein